MKTVEVEPGSPGKWLRRMFDESLPRRPFPSRKQSWHSPRMEWDHQTLNQRQVRFSRFSVKGIYAFSLDVFVIIFLTIQCVSGWCMLEPGEAGDKQPSRRAEDRCLKMVIVIILDGWVLVMVIIFDGWALADILFPVMIIGSDGRGCDKIEGDL